MKIKIEYDYWGNDFRAFTYFKEAVAVGLSDVSFEDAKKQLIEFIKGEQKETPPKPEEVEI